MANIEWAKMTPAQKKEELYRKQKRTLELFLERNAISKEHYDQCLADLRAKMGMEHLDD